MPEEDRGFTLQGARGQESQGGASGTTRESAGAGGSAAQRTVPLPPVDFAGFLLGLGQMALMHLGEMSEPQTGERRPDLNQARHAIDLLDLLEEKTRGNLSDEEANLLSYLRSDLKLRYVRLTK